MGFLWKATKGFIKDPIGRLEKDAQNEGWLPKPNAPKEEYTMHKLRSPDGRQDQLRVQPKYYQPPL